MVDFDEILDEEIQALVDDQLDEDEALSVALRIGKCDIAHARYQELLKQNNLLKLWWKNYLH